MEVEQEAKTMEPIQEYYVSYFSQREFEIAEILVGLPDIISKLDYRPRIWVPWGHKKKRSALVVQDRKVNKSRLPSLSSSPNLGSKVAGDNVGKAERSSPNTPLSFESDEKPSQSRRKVVAGCKRKREEWLEVIDRYLKRKDVLQIEVQKVRDYKEKLIDLKMVLQSRKQELEKQTLIQKESQVKIEGENLDLDMQLGQPTLPTSIVICAPTIVEQEHYHQQIAPHQYQTSICTAQTRKAVISENHGYLAFTTQVASTSLPCNSVNATGVRLVSNNNGGSILVSDYGYSFPNQDWASSLDTKTLLEKAKSKQRRQDRYQKNREKRTSILGQRHSQEFRNG